MGNRCEPVIGRIKPDGKLECDFLLEGVGEKIKVPLCGAGHHPRRLRNTLWENALPRIAELRLPLRRGAN